jgi:signal transduction histidine kinase
MDRLGRALVNLRRLRGLRVQLLLWIIAPLAVVLIVLSLAGITRHRQAMTQLVADRNRGLALAEANRLGREIDGRAAVLQRRASEGEGVEDAAALQTLAADLRDEYSGGLAVLDATGRVIAASEAAWSWVGTAAATTLIGHTVNAAQPQFHNHFDPANPHLLIGVPLPGSRALIGAIPTETLSLAESSAQVETETHGAVFVLDATGRLVHHHNPGGLAVDEAALADLVVASAGTAGAAELRGAAPGLLVTYAPVLPPGWTLVVAEHVHAVDIMGLSVVEVLPLLLLFVALVALLAVSFGVINVVRPLQELDRRAQRVAWGDFDAVKQPVGGVQEMDDLRATLAQMAERIRAYQAGMRDYLSAVTQAQEAERARLAHELHDDTVQALIALKQRAQMAHKALAADPARAGQRLDELSSLIDGELVSLRRLIGDLRPIYLEDLGFVPALEMLAQQVEERHGLAVRLEVRGQMVRLAPDLELAAFRIVQAALNNVAAHAEAHNVAVTSYFTDTGVTLAVQDDGCGFNPPEQPAELTRDGHFGLMGMRERAILYGGHLTIDSAPGRGTTITAWLPVQ